ncbi:MAG: hypothetical protein ACJASL_003501 [Paraglaciecola sp.]
MKKGHLGGLFYWSQFLQYGSERVFSVTKSSLFDDGPKGENGRRAGKDAWNHLAVM